MQSLKFVAADTFIPSFAQRESKEAVLAPRFDSEGAKMNYTH